MFRTEARSAVSLKMQINGIKRFRGELRLSDGLLECEPCVLPARRTPGYRDGRAGSTGLHPAIRKSVYLPGERIPVFAADGLTFGILICNDSNFPEVGRAMAGQGAAALLIPTNNALPPAKADVVEDARRADVTLATENGVWIIRADVAGESEGSVSHGSSAIVEPDGTVLRSAGRLTEDLLVAEIRISPDLPQTWRRNTRALGTAH